MWQAQNKQPMWQNKFLGDNVIEKGNDIILNLC
jgi:hypothetical protein